MLTLADFARDAVDESFPANVDQRFISLMNEEILKVQNTLHSHGWSLPLSKPPKLLPK
jgi:uncharacterized protein YcgL (UPF0745 family)